MSCLRHWPGLLSALCLVCVSVLLAGCGGGAQPSPATHVPAAFELNVDPASELSALQVQCHRDGPATTVKVVSAKDEPAGGLLFELQYDALRYTPVSSRATGALARADECLYLDVLDTPGVVSIGQVPLTEPTGTVPAGTTLIEVTFADRPFTVQASRTVSAIPTHPGAAATLEWNTATKEFHWYYQNPGDYSQDGEVGISDLVPLGQHFNTLVPFGTGLVESVIDGNGDGEVNISDLTTIGQHFGSSIDGYYLRCSDDPADLPDGVTGTTTDTPLLSFPMDSATGDPTKVRLRFTREYSPGTELLRYYWVCPVYNQVEGACSNICDLESTPGNHAPTAAFSINEPTGDAPHQVIVDPQDSTDTDGTIETFEWDWESDGTYDQTSTTPSTASHTYTEPGEYTITLRVTDNNWVQDTVTGTVTVNPPVEALFTVDHISGKAPFTVYADPGGSSSSGGSITLYEWDWDGDGTYEDGQATASVASHTFNDPGYYRINLRVTDGGSQSGTCYIWVGALPTLTPDTAWPMYGHDVRNTHRSPNTSAQSATGLTTSGTDIMGVSWSQAVDSDGVAYFGGFAGGSYLSLDAVNPDLSVKWHFELDSPAHRSPAVAPDGTIYVGCRNGMFHSVSPGGVENWSLNTDGQPNEYWADMESYPAVDWDGTVYFGGRNQRFYALNPDSSVRWTIDTGSPVMGSAAVAGDGTVYFAGADGTIHAVENDGTPKWQYAAGTMAFTPTIGDTGCVYVSLLTADGQRLLALNPDGTLNWTVNTSDWLNADPAIGADGTIYLCTLTSLISISPAGTTNWETPLSSPTYTPPVVGGDGKIYVRDEGLISCFSAAGTVLWATPNTGGNVGAFAIGPDGTLFYQDDVLTAIAP